MSRRSQIITCICVLAAIGCCSLWVMSIFKPQRSIYVSSELRRLLGALGYPQRVQDFVGRSFANQKALRPYSVDEWSMTFVPYNEKVAAVLGDQGSGRYYTAALCRGAIVVNVVEATHTTDVYCPDDAYCPDEISIRIADSYNMPLWILALLALLYPVYQVLPATKRKRRRQSGLCENCGYDLRGSESGVCSECGAAISKHVK